VIDQFSTDLARVELVSLVTKQSRNFQVWVKVVFDGQLAMQLVLGGTAEFRKQHLDLIATNHTVPNLNGGFT
jgi:hypothetical protein